MTPGQEQDTIDYFVGGSGGWYVYVIHIIICCVEISQYGPKQSLSNYHHKYILAFDETYRNQIMHWDIY